MRERDEDDLFEIWYDLVLPDEDDEENEELFHKWLDSFHWERKIRLHDLKNIFSKNRKTTGKTVRKAT